MTGSESWTCADCGAPQAGNRPDDDRCGGCLRDLRRRLGAEHQRQNHEVHGGGAP